MGVQASGQGGLYRRDWYGGALMVAIGLAAILQAVTYRVGTLTSMGSGFFPASLGVLLVAIGLLIAGGARRASRPKESTAHAPEWRGWFCILLSIVAFVALGKYAGLVPASFAITFIAALGDRDNTWLSALLLAVLITVISVVVFWWGLQLSLPLFGRS